jgi:hypothetical protein
LNDTQRQWFPIYTDRSTIKGQQLVRLRFPERFESVHIDWLPTEFNVKVSQVNLSIYEQKVSMPRPLSALVRQQDLLSHSTIYQRLSSFLPMKSSSVRSNPSPIVFDMYTSRKHFRRHSTQPVDFFLQIKQGNEPFDFNEIYDEHSERCLTAIVQHGDICFYSWKTFDVQR